MPELLSLSRAARLAGISRAELQKRARRGEIATFEGQVAVSDLLRLYPQMTLEGDAAFQRVERIKAAAVPKTRELDAVLPSPQVLVSRLRALSDVVVEKIAALDAAETLLAETSGRLDELAEAPPQRLASRLEEIRSWLAVERRALAQRPKTDGRAQLFAKDTLLRVMAAHVKIIPSGHEFFVEGTETILEASVKAGLKLDYGCSSGNCGACKARVLSGEVSRTRDHDYVLSEREKQMGYVLTCSNTAVTDVVLEAAEALSVDDIPAQEIRASVRKVERLDENIVQLHAQTPRTQTLRFMAGQSVTLTLEDGAAARLPIASCPCNGRNLLFFVRRLPGDGFSAAVFDGRVHHGQMIRIQGPQGRFVLAEDSPEPAVFIAFSDGIAPVKSLIEHAVSIDVIEAFHLYWVVPEPEGQYLARWCRALKESLDNFAYTPLIDSTVEDLLAVLRTDLADPSEARFYVAGPRADVQALAAGLGNLAISAERIALEAID